MCSNKCRLHRPLLNSKILSATNIYVNLHFICSIKQLSDTHHTKNSLATGFSGNEIQSGHKNTHEGGKIEVLLLLPLSVKYKQ